MGSWEETPNQTQTESGFNSNTHLPDLCPGPAKEEETIVEGLKNLALEESGWNSYGGEEEDNNNSRYNESLQVDWQSGENSQYPLRPYAGDCSFYLKTGNCKFGLNCKFNHPVGRGFQDKENHKGWTAEMTGQIECKYYRAAGGCKYGKACRYRHSNEDHVLAPLEVNSPGLPLQVGLNEKKDGIIEQMGQIECKYYLTSGGCKYGNACRYSHSKVNSLYLEKSEIAPPELNFLGLPIRVLAKECPYYMRNGTCAYGPSCKFNHPDPTAAEGSKTFSPDPFGFLGDSSGNHNGETNPLRLLRASEPIAASLSSNMKLDKHVPYLDHNSSYAHQLPLNSGWNERQEKASHPYLGPSIQNATKTADISKLYQEQIRVDEFPERPGEPECPYFMKTGYCKYKAACKFHHPKTRLSNPPALNLSSAGLPLRPERRICWNYEKFGICKYGSSCFFHHPDNHSSSSALLVDPLQ